jgi:transposase InsO family protein
MGWFILAHIFSTMLMFMRIGRLSEQEKDLEILLLRHQLSILERKCNKQVRPSRAEKLTLAVLAKMLKQTTNRTARQLRGIIRIFQPETVLRWHRELVRRKWTFAYKHKGGRPQLCKEIERLIVRLAKENPRWGYGKVEGEFLKLGFQVSVTTIRNILERHSIVPAPVRGGSIGWRHLMTHYKMQILACDFFTVETLWLQTLYVLFFIDLGTRHVYLAGVTANPHNNWVTKQAKQLVWELEENETTFRFLIHDRDKKFTNVFDAIFESEGINIILTPYYAPNANAYAERWVRTVRTECLDLILILNATHLRRVLLVYIDDYYNVARPHQGIRQKTPIPRKQPFNAGAVQRRKVLGGIINDYYRASSNTPVYLS